MFDAKQNYRYEIQYYFIPELVEVVSKRILPSAVFTMFDIWERILRINTEVILYLSKVMTARR